REARFATMAEMAKELEAVLPSLPGPAADVGAFVRDVIGERGEKRRGALRDAQRIADLRKDLLQAAHRDSVPRSSHAETGLSAVSMLTIPLVSVLTPPAQSAVPDEDSASPPSTSTSAAATLSTAPPRTPKRGRAVTVALVAAALGIATLWVMTRSS